MLNRQQRRKLDKSAKGQVSGDVLEFGMYSKYLKRAGFTEGQLHRIYKVDPNKSTQSLRKLYEEHCPDGPTYAEYEKALNDNVDLFKEDQT